MQNCEIVIQISKIAGQLTHQEGPYTATWSLCQAPASMTRL